MSSSAAERSLDDLLGAERYIVIGANSGGDTVARFLNQRGKRVEAFADLDSTRAGSAWLGCPVIRLEDVPSAVNNATAVVIGSFKHSEISTRLIRDLGVDPARIYPFVNDMFARHYEPDLYRRNAGKIARVRSLLSDAESQTYFDRVMAFYRTLDPQLLTPNPKAYGLYGYHAPGVKPGSDAVIVDVGAFTGDTCSFYFGETAGHCFIYAVEAYLPNFMRLMQSFGNDSRVKPLHLALGAVSGALMLEGDPSIADACAHPRASAEELSSLDLVLCETLDRLFSIHLTDRIDLIKIDVEGGDLDVLRGAAETVRRDHPLLAIASYHTPEHIWEIPLLAAELLGPCRIYAGHDPKWIHQIHYLLVPEGRT